MSVLAVLLVGLAHASDMVDLNKNRVSTRNTPLQEILQQSAVVVEGELLDVRFDVWMGPAGTSEMLLWTIRVDEELMGHVESGVIELSIFEEFPPTLVPGDRILVMANVKTLYLPTFVEGRAPRYEVFPAYEDLLVPTVYGSLYFAERELAGTDDEWSSPGSQDGADWLPSTREETNALTWQDLLGRVRQGVSACGACGAVVPGAVSADVQP